MRVPKLLSQRLDVQSYISIVLSPPIAYCIIKMSEAAVAVFMVLADFDGIVYSRVRARGGKVSFTLYLLLDTILSYFGE
jgi:hypothetical protein